MPLPSPRKVGLRAGRQMQVERCEIPSAGALETLCRKRFETVPYGRRCNKPAPCLTRGRMREIPRSAGLMDVFQRPAKNFLTRLDVFLYFER